MKRFLLSVIGLSLCLAPATGRSAYYHEDLPCSDCHTLHYSEDGEPLKTETGGPFAQLNIRSTTNALCLFCHDGYDVRAPDVQADDAVFTLAYYNDSGDEHSGAGFFANSEGTNINGHDLGEEAATPYNSANQLMTLTCASCHDPHGTTNYRDLVTAPAGGAGVAVTLGTAYDSETDDPDVFWQNLPGDPPAKADSVAAYKESNMGYRAMTSAWCTECHDKLKTQLAATSRDGNLSPAHHLANVPINGSGYPTDPTHWYNGTGDGFGDATGDAVAGVPRLRFQVSGTTADYTASRAVAASNEVICTSCHLAHGGKFKKGLVWPFKDSGSPADKDSGCLQCHDPTQL